MSAASSFAAVLHQLSELHEQEIHDLKERLSGQLQVNEQQREEIQRLRQCNQRLQQAISSAKKKIKQYKIPEHTNGGEETLTEDSLRSPVVQLLPTENAGCVKDTPSRCQQLNKTCMALFESPSVNEEGQVTHKRTSEATESGHHPINKPWELGESVETTAESCDDVVIIDDAVHTHQSDGGECDSEEETMESEELTTESEEHCNKHSNEDSSDNEHTADAPIHLIYSHGRDHDSPLAKKSFPIPNKPHPSSVSTGHSLVRREVRGKIRYKVIEKNPLHQQPSVTDLTQDTGDSTTPQNESDCDSNSSSPSLLNTSSQWRACPPSSDPSPPLLHTKQHDVMTCSLFPSTPLSTSDSNSISVTPPPPATASASRGGGGGPVIPSSDSQLSLDVSQSIPFSPELKDPFIRTIITPPVASTGCQDDSCCVEISEPMCLEPVKEKRPVNRQLSLGKRRSPNRRVVTREDNRSVCGDASVASPGDKPTRNSPSRNVVLATPGVKSVNNILHKSNGWMALQPHTHLQSSNTSSAKNPSSRQPGHKHHSSQEDVEEVIPRKRLHLATDRRSKCSDQTSWREKTTAATNQTTLLQSQSTVQQDNHETHLMAELDKVLETTTNHHPHDSALRLAERAGLPGDYKFAAVIRKRADRDKLDGKACPDCHAWYMDEDGVHNGQREHLKHTCRHKHLHLPPDTDPRLWEISFPDTDECEHLMR